MKHRNLFYISSFIMFCYVVSLSSSMAGNIERSSSKDCITILSMDGGGVRGIIPAVVLQRLEAIIQELDGPNARIADYFDIIAGTSAGGITTSLLTAPDDGGRRPKYTASQIVDFHEKNWSRIFPPVRDKNIKDLLWVNHLVGPMYQHENFYEVMNDALGDAKVSAALTDVLITAFDIKTMQPVIFSSFEAKRDPTLDAPLKDVALATCSAPFAFPPYYFNYTDSNTGKTKEYNLVDGYIVADNPTWLAVTDGLKKYSKHYSKSPMSIYKLLILSLGTGTPKVEPKYDAKIAKNWGTIQWLYSFQDGGRPHNDIFKAGATNLADIQLRSFLKAVGCEEDTHYVRIQKYNLSSELVSVVDASEENIKKLHTLAKELADQKNQTLKDFANLLVSKKQKLSQVGNKEGDLQQDLVSVDNLSEENIEKLKEHANKLVQEHIGKILKQMSA